MMSERRDAKSDGRGRLMPVIVSLAFAALAMTTLQAFAQGAAQRVAENAGAPLAFSAVTIHPTNVSDARRGFGIQVSASGQLVFSGMPLKSLVMFAYSAEKLERVDGGAPWTGSDPFDISAQVAKADMADWDKASDGEHIVRVRPQLQALLEQRFKLKGHTAMVSTPVWALVQAKGGSKLKEVPKPTAAELQEDEKRREANKASDPPQLGLDVTPTGWVGHAVKIQELMNGLGYALPGLRTTSRWWTRRGSPAITIWR